MRRAVTKQADSGITLIELLVAILILALGSFAALRASDQSALSITGNTDRALAQIAVQNRAERLRFLGAEASALPDTVRLAGRDFRITQTNTATTGGLIEAGITARGPGGAGAQLVVFLIGRPF